MANGCAFPRLCSSSQVFSVVEYLFHWIRKVWQPSFRFYLVSRDSTHLIFLYSVYKVWWWLVEIGAMFHSLLIGSQKRCMGNWMDVPPRWDAKVEGCVGHYFFNFKETSPFHLELPPPRWRFVISSHTLSPTFHGMNLDVICSFIFCWATLWTA